MSIRSTQSPRALLATAKGTSSPNLARRESVGSISVEEYRRIANPRRKRNQPERELHTKVATYLDRALPAQAYWFPIPNGSHRRPSVAKKMKEAGEVKPGVPDICIVYRGKPLFVELKAGRNQPTAIQKAAHKEIMLAGGLVFVGRSVEHLRQFIMQIIPMQVWE